MIGGGPGAFIGPVHRTAAELDGEIELVAGAFSSDPERSRQAGQAYRIDPARAYADVATMIAAEAARDDGVDFVTIASPNRHHLPAATTSLEAGIAVLSDKPATATLAEPASWPRSSPAPVVRMASPTPIPAIRWSAGTDRCRTHRHRAQGDR